MSDLWEQATSPDALLTALDEQGQQRRLTLLACLFFRRIANGPGRHLALNPRRDDPRTGWAALLRCVEERADAPDDPTVRDALCLLRTEIAVECQALGRMLMQHTSHQPEVRPVDPAPVFLLPRLILVALGTMLITPPSPLARTSVDPELYGEPLPLETSDLPADHPRVFAERRFRALLPSTAGPIPVASCLLEGLIASGLGLLLSADGSEGELPNLASIMVDLRLQSPDELSLIVDGAADLGHPQIRDLLREWTDEMISLLARMPDRSPAWMQVTGIAFLDAGLSLLSETEMTIEKFQEHRRRQADTIRLFAGPLENPPPIDPVWILRDDQRVGRLAQVIYQERRWDDLPILGDALEEAGCESRELLDQLHATAVPFRGWWLLDALRLPGEVT